MEESQINRDGVILDVEFDFEDADHSVGYDGGVQIHSIKHQCVDIWDLLDKKVVESIAQEIYDRY